MEGLTGARSLREESITVGNTWKRELEAWLVLSLLSLSLSFYLIQDPINGDTPVFRVALPSLVKTFLETFS